MVESPPTRALRRAANVSGVLCMLLGVLTAAVRVRLGEDASFGLTGLGLMAAGTGLVASFSVIASSRSVWMPLRPLMLVALGVGLLEGASASERVGLTLQLSIVLGTLALAVRSNRRILREKTLEPPQRALQLVLTWCLPFVGSLLVLAYYGAEDDPWRDDGFDASPGNHVLF